MTSKSAQHDSPLHRLADRYVSLANAHDVDEVLAMHDSRFVSHDAEGVTHTLADHGRTLRAFFAAFPDVKLRSLNVVAEGDLLVMNLMTTGTNTGPYGDEPPTGRGIHIAEIHVRRIERGKIVEHWGLLDLATLRAQLQA